MAERKTIVYPNPEVLAQAVYRVLDRMQQQDF